MTHGKLPHTAITSWSGFVYQGKVAIYHVLQLLESPETCTGFALQLDCLEDFAILDGDGTTISMHQVKAKKTQYYSGYKKDFEKLKEKADEQECTDAKFHVARAINNRSEQDIEKDHSPVKFYKYDGDYCCPVDEIDQKIEGKLQTLFATRYPEDIYKHFNEYASKARSYLDQIVLKRVLVTHRIIHDDLAPQAEAAYKQTIPFSEFIDILSDDLQQRGQGEEYYLYVLLGDIHQYYQHYCIDNEDEVSDDELKKLSYCMKVIGELDIPPMIQFIRNIIPHRDFKFRTLADFKEKTFNQEEFQDAFLTTMKRLKQPEYNPKNFFRWHAEGKSFTPTTINTAAAHARKICRNIIKNAKQTDLNIMFEGNNLITSGINVDSILDEVPEVVRTPAEEEDCDKRHHVTRWKNVALVSLENATEVINA
jgi:hypothetical protein